jgi:hypothetical protein
MELEDELRSGDRSQDAELEAASFPNSPQLPRPSTTINIVHTQAQAKFVAVTHNFVANIGLI